MQETIRVRIKNVYGNDLTYPNCITSEKLVALIGKKTFSTGDLTKLKDLGFNIVYN